MSMGPTPFSYFFIFRQYGACMNNVAENGNNFMDSQERVGKIVG